MFLTWQQNGAKSPEDLQSTQHDIPVPQREEVSEVREDQPRGPDDAEPREEPARGKSLQRIVTPRLVQIRCKVIEKYIFGESFLQSASRVSKCR